MPVLLVRHEARAHEALARPANALVANVSSGLGMSLFWKGGKLCMGSLVVPFWGLPYRILNINHKKELPRSLWVCIHQGTRKSRT